MLPRALPTHRDTSAAIPGFTILFVCTANVCRSPMAEAMAQALVERLGAAGPVVVSSAGVRVSARALTERATLDVLAVRGLNAAARPARLLTAEAISSSDLVLTADRTHRASVLRLRPAALRRTFTLLEFARIASTSCAKVCLSEPSRAHAVVRTAATQRALVPPTTPDSDDIADPYGQPEQAFGRCADVIATALRTTLPALFGWST
jgi:protein-tyrosine phosphatase